MRDDAQDAWRPTDSKNRLTFVQIEAARHLQSHKLSETYFAHFQPHDEI
jgi:hypothetical protein